MKGELIPKLGKCSPNLYAKVNYVPILLSISGLKACGFKEKMKMIIYRLLEIFTFSRYTMLSLFCDVNGNICLTTTK